MNLKWIWDILDPLADSIHKNLADLREFITVHGVDVVPVWFAIVNKISIDADEHILMLGKNKLVHNLYGWKPASTFLVHF